LAANSNTPLKQLKLEWGTTADLSQICTAALLLYRSFAEAAEVADFIWLDGFTAAPRDKLLASQGNIHASLT